MKVLQPLVAGGAALAVALVVATAFALHARKRPLGAGLLPDPVGEKSSLDFEAWHAKSVFVLALSERGTYELEESWVGTPDVSTGRTLATRIATSEKQRQLYDRKTDTCRVVGAHRVVVFAVPRPMRWHGSAVALIENGEVYLPFVTRHHVADVMACGPVDAMRGRVRYVAAVRDALELETLRPDPERLEEFLATNVWLARSEALDALRFCGRSAVPVLGRHLERVPLDRDAIQLLGHRKTPESARILTRLLERELAYWKTVGPHLPTQWRFSDESFDWGELYATEATLDAFRALADPSCRPVVQQFCDFFRTLPPSGDDSSYAIDIHVAAARKALKTW